MVENNNQNNIDQDIWSLYLYALKSPVTREKYQKRLEKFFDFLGLDGVTAEEKSKDFINRIKEENNQWVFNSLLRFMQFHLERVNRKEITRATVRNYLEHQTILPNGRSAPYIKYKKLSNLYFYDMLFWYITINSFFKVL